MVTTVTIGRKPASRDPDYGMIGEDVFRACVFNRISQNLWLRQIGIIAGIASGAASIDARLACYVAGSNHVPATRRALVGLFPVTASMPTWDTGGVYEKPLTIADNGPSNTAARLFPNEYIGFGVESDTAGVLGHGMIQASAITADEERFFQITGVDTPPTTFPGGYSAFTAGHMSIWGTCDVNEAPHTPVNRSESNLNTVTPTLSADFRDENGAYGASNGSGRNVGDVLNQVKIQVRPAGGGSLLWDWTYNASSTEKANNRASKVYAGSALTLGSSYEWCTAHSDQFGEWSSFSAWKTFTLVAAGSTTLTAPTGKQLTVTPTLTGVYSHQTNRAAANIKIRAKYNGIYVRESPWITKSVSAGASWSQAWPTSGTFLALEWGFPYTIEVAFRDVDGVETAYATKDITTDAPPNVPSNLNPRDSAISTTYPKLTFAMTDPDNTSATGLIGKARIFGPMPITNNAFAGTITGWTVGTASGVTRTFTYDGANGNTANGSGKVAVTASTAAAGTKLIVTNDTKLPVLVGQSYTGRIAVRTDNVNITPRTIIQWFTAADALISPTAEEADWTPTASTWASRFVSGTAPANAAYMKIGAELYWDTANQTGNVWLDDGSADDGYRFIRTATFNGTAGLWEYQTTSTDLAAYSPSYSWDAYGWDGTLASGTATSESLATCSQPAAFTYSQGPTVTITAPIGTITSSTTAVTWTCPTQSQRRVELLVNGVVQIDSDWAVTASTTYTPVSGKLHNNDVVTYRVSVKDAGLLTGQDTRTVTLTYTPPSPVAGLLVSPDLAGDDGYPTIVRMSWEQSTDPNFLAYLVYRDGQLVARQTSSTSIVYIDYEPISHTTHTYAVYVLVKRDLDEITSEPESAEAQVQLSGVVLHSVGDPTQRVAVRTWRDRSHAQDGEETVYKTWGASAPITVADTSVWWTTDVELLLGPDDSGSGYQKRDALEAMGVLGGPLVYRDADRRLRVVTIPRSGGLSITDLRGGKFSASLSLRDEDREAVT